jgi:prefoldin subunit 5
VSEYEKLGAFYLGRTYDSTAARVTDELVLYDAKDLTTHAVCVGMTGSGKTGLCLSLLEEAAIDGIPALAIDPKGDLGNLLLTFPDLSPDSFEPWIDAAEATRAGMTPKQYAAQAAARWKKGLAEWGQDGERIARFRESVDVAIYTPGSSAGRPLRVLQSLAAPGAQAPVDEDALRERVQSAVSGLLTLLGLEPDPVRSREHILLSSLIHRAWAQGRDLDLAALIAEIQSPPFERLGVMDLESFFPGSERFEFAMRLNALLAAPGFQAWLEGEPLDVQGLLYTPLGRPRLSILSIAHLSDAERMFFVTILLNEVVAWMRSQPGTSSLRALLYMDEVFGYFPPTANPPSKTPMLTLLKQARAYGLGVVLATQNPVDLDYKGLSNAGTWFVGRLQTERDKARLLDGLEGASTTSGASFDRRELERTISGLRSRVFLLNNVHDDRPELFHTRWALSYLRGPLTREQIRALSVPPETPIEPTSERRRAEDVAARETNAVDRPLLPPDVPEAFAVRRSAIPSGSTLVYRPALLGAGRVHYVDRRAGVDHWAEVRRLAALRDDPPVDLWDHAENPLDTLELEGEPELDIKFTALPAVAGRVPSYTAWRKRLASSLYRTEALQLYRSREFRQYSGLGVDEAAFRAGLAQLARERRDQAVEQLRKRYAPKLTRLQQRIRTAEERVERHRSQHKHEKLQTVVSLGATVLGALFGRRAASIGTVGRATTTVRGASRAARKKEDVDRALERLEESREQLEALEQEFQDQAAEVAERIDPAALELEEHRVRPRKADIQVGQVTLLWTPWSVSREGIAEPLY